MPPIRPTFASARSPSPQRRTSLWGLRAARARPVRSRPLPTRAAACDRLRFARAERMCRSRPRALSERDVVRVRSLLGEMDNRATTPTLMRYSISATARAHRILKVPDHDTSRHHRILCLARAASADMLCCLEGRFLSERRRLERVQPDSPRVSGVHLRLCFLGQPSQGLIEEVVRNAGQVVIWSLIPVRIRSRPKCQRGGTAPGLRPPSGVRPTARQPAQVGTCAGGRRRMAKDSRRYAPRRRAQRRRLPISKEAWTYLTDSQAVLHEQALAIYFGQ